MKAFVSIAGFALVALMSVPAMAQAQHGPWMKSVSMMGEPKYKDGFAHFDYVNPDAPKGGTVRLSTEGGFDTFNPILPMGEPAAGIGLIYETLMTPSSDEVFTKYGLLAEAIAFPADYSSVSFKLNPKAKWQDGEPVTADDVVWSFNKLIELNPTRQQYYANVKSAEITGDGEVTFTFDKAGNRELPLIMSEIPILPKHWWEGKDANGKQRDISASTLETPMGSGPYKVKSFVPGRTLTFERDPNYWAATEPVNVGQDNFDQIRYEYFRDTDVEFEAFKGDQFDWWAENRAKRWATAYDFPAVKDGRVVLEKFENDSRDNGVMVGFIYNLRQEKFKDQRVREALNYAFDFEELNRTLFYNEYSRVNSFFYGSELASSSDLPTGKELEILESVKDKIPASVFTTPYKSPVGGDSTKLRANLREALRLLGEAGYKLDGNRLVDANGQQLTFEILLNGPTIQPVASSFINNLRSIGVDATVRSVDSPQFINRLRSYDYDMVYMAWGQTLSPGNEQRFFWGSEAASQQGSQNYSGISDPGVDALIDKIIFATDRETLVAATHALDRVLLAHSIVVPSYASLTSRIARWDRFSHPDNLPEYSVGFPSVWWYDEAKAAKVGAAN
ncbi:extracellular solute-binding protein [Paradevosia shaoguanensis]|uniref:extracellular solute-binding protein n=1 Tax=Paradevosia shaoguanensis TaxID=1335043 RepID=UPI003C7187D0